MTKRLRYIYHGYVQIAEIDAADETAPYVAKTYRWDPSEPVATRPLALSLWTREGTVRETLYYAHDLRKNVVSLFDAQGMRRASYQYDPYGNITSIEGDMAESNPYRFSSEHHDEDLGLVYYNYRHYNPTDGRWISRDPIAEKGGWNLYGFVANRPTEAVDYLGECCFYAKIEKIQKKKPKKKPEKKKAYKPVTWPKGHVTGYTYADNDPPYSDRAANQAAVFRSLRQDENGYWGTDFYRSNITNATYDHPSSMAISKEYLDRCPYGSKVFVDGIGWFIVVSFAGAVDANGPRLDLWMGTASKSDTHSISGNRRVTCYPKGCVPPETEKKFKGSTMWKYKEWNSPLQRAIALIGWRQRNLKKNEPWPGLYIDGTLYQDTFLDGDTESTNHIYLLR